MNPQNSHKGHTRSRSCMELYSELHQQSGSTIAGDYHYFVFESTAKIKEGFGANHQEFEPWVGTKPVNRPIEPLKPPPRLQINTALKSSNRRFPDQIEQLKPSSSIKSNAGSTNFCQRFRTGYRLPLSDRDESLERHQRLQSNADLKSFSQRFTTSSGRWEPLNSTIKSLKASSRPISNASVKGLGQKFNISSHKFPFARLATWNDDFDPFTVALQKVKGEEKEESGQDPQTRSYFSRFMPTGPSSPKNEAQVPLRGQKLSKFDTSLSYCGKHTDQNGSDKSKGKNAQTNNEGITNMAKLKAILQRRASFLQNKNRSKKICTSEDQKPSYFSGLGFRQKGQP